MAQLGWSIDLKKCIGCHACAVACKAEMNTAPQTSPLEVDDVTAEAVNYRRVLYLDSGSYPDVSRTFVTMSCQHCYYPACMKACPVGAITKRASDGIVLIDYDKCIGCKYCIWACPYGAPQYNETTRKVEKCTFCSHRIDAGLKPACVTTCAGRALNYETFTQSNSGQNAPSGFADPDLTTPAVRFST